MSAREIGDLVVVDAAHDDDVELDGIEAGVARRSRRGDRIERETPARDLRDALRAQRVGAHVHAVEPGGAQRPASSGSFTPLVESAMSSMPGTARSMRTSVDQVRTDRRLAAGDAQPPEPERRELPHHLGDLLVREDLRLREPLEPLERHAVDAAEVAAVRDGDAQVLDRPPELVLQRESGHGAAFRASEAAESAAGAIEADRPTRAFRRRSAPASRSARAS